MKKLLTILLALVAISGFAFAEDAVLVLSGSVQTGFQFNGDTTAGATAKIWESNNGAPSSIWFDGVFAGTNAGGKFEFFVNDLDTEAVKADALFGWWKPIEMLTISAGQGYGDAYSTPIEGWDNGSTGFQVKVAPITGLVIAIDYPFAKVTPVAFDPMALQFAAGYTLTDIASFGANVSLAGTYIVGASLLAVKDLTAMVDFKYTTADSGIYLEEKIGYAIAGASPYIWSSQTITTAFAWEGKIGASYALASVTPEAYFQYGSDSTWHTGVAAGWTVEKNAIRVYGDYNSDTTFDFGLRYIVSF